VKLETHIETFDEALYLESGRILEKFDVAYESYGELNSDRSNVIIVCHALTGSHHAAGTYQGESKAGWWDGLIGDNKTIDTKQYFVICCNVLGSCFGSTSPMSLNEHDEHYRYKFPVLTISDMVNAQIRLFDRLDIQSAQAVIGGSMGGMQAIAFAVDHPKFAKRTIILASTYATSPWAIAFNKVASESILKDPAFKNGYYEPNSFLESGLSGMAVGRMAGHISFLSHESMQEKFGREYVAQDGLYELFGKFQVERYLEYNSYNFTRYFDPLSYLYITKAINIFDMSRGFDTLSDTLKVVKTTMTILGFKSDLLFKPEESEMIHNSMVEAGNGSRSSYIEIDSTYGHDAFLVELDLFKHHIKDALDEQPN
jgi:homoserine O-acetyltransferase/O-succinyltransferase